jgi:RHS repeat-associated protein
MEMAGRGFSGSYRFGYQGSEKDNEVSGDGNTYTTEFRQLDPRLGRWFSVDPVFQPWQSPYTSMDNNPIGLNDPKGDVVPENAPKNAKEGDVHTEGPFSWSYENGSWVEIPKILSPVVCEKAKKTANSDGGSFWSNLRQKVQFSLDIAAIVPGVSLLADVINITISAASGDIEDVKERLMWLGVGAAVGGSAKLVHNIYKARKAAKAAKAAAEAAAEAIKKADDAKQIAQNVKKAEEVVEDVKEVEKNITKQADDVVDEGTKKADEVVKESEEGLLGNHEKWGGHTIEKHVGKTDEELIERLAKEPRTPAASTYTDLSTAEGMIRKTIASNKVLIDDWVKSAKKGDKLVLNETGTEAIGRGINRGTEIGDRSNARTVLKAIGDGYYFVLTSFPY